MKNFIFVVIGIVVIYYIYNSFTSNNSDNNNKTNEYVKISPSPIILCGQKQRVNTIEEYKRYLNLNQETEYTNEIGFIKKICPYVQKINDDSNIPWQVVIAQACLESNYGKNEIKDPKTKDSTFNIFGIKFNPDVDKEYVEVSTNEEYNGKMHKEVCKFAKYISYDDCFKSYKSIMMNSVFVHAIKNADDPIQYIRDIQSELPDENHSKYATDSQYSNKIIKIMEDLKMIEKSIM